MAHRKKDIYLCKSVEELNTKAESTDTTKFQLSNPNNLIMKGDNLLKDAKTSLSFGDEEQSYLHFMNAATMYLGVKHTKLFQHAPNFYSEMIRPNLKEAVTNCEMLSGNLKRRYNLLKIARESEEKIKE